MIGRFGSLLHLEIDGDICNWFYVSTQFDALAAAGDCFACFLCKRRSSPGANQKCPARSQLWRVRVCQLPGGGKSDTGRQGAGDCMREWRTGGNRCPGTDHGYRIYTHGEMHGGGRLLRCESDGESVSLSGCQRLPCGRSALWRTVHLRNRLFGRRHLCFGLPLWRHPIESRSAAGNRSI